MIAVRKVISIAALACLAVMVAAVPARAEEERSKGYYTMVDKDTGQVICRTGIVIYPGDQYLTGNNLLYRVVRLDGDTAYAEYLGREELSAALPPERGWLARAFDGVAGFLGLAQGGGKSGPVAIYHTHSDESYIPTDGAASTPGFGGIYRVGKSLAERLMRGGVRAIHSEANHNPHDGLAYERSRRTATDLLKQSPAALLDVHRDAAPRQEYADQVNSQGVTKVQIVLGRSNPNLKANEAFARRLKAVVDRKYPGLIKGIYYGHGKYNQDLSPRALLLEMGAQSNARESAERGAMIFAAAAESLVGAGPAGRSREASGAWRSVLYVLGGVLVVAVIFLLLNSGSFSGASRNLGRFFRSEFTSALGAKKPKRTKATEPGQDEGDRRDRE
ncbi:MAG: stage II sporulation protein P [Bacteroidota bacterium]